MRRFDRASTTPIELSGDPDRVSQRWPTNEPNEGDLEAIAAVCPVSVDLVDTAEHARDWWPLAMSWSLRNEVPAKPWAVCRPADTATVSRLLAVCNERGVPVTVSGGRSGVCGAAIPLEGGIVLDTSALQGVDEIDAVSGLIEVLSGTYGPDLENVARDHGLTVGHYPQSFDISTVGGWIASRGAGQYSTRYGKIDDMVHALEVVLADGTVVRTGGAPAAAAGPDLTQVILGSEGTLGVVTRAWLRAHPTPEVERRAAYVFGSFSDGLEACRRAIRAGATPAVLRLYDGAESARSHGGDGTQSTLLVLDEGTEALVDATMATVHEACHALGATDADTSLVEAWMHHRNDTSALQALTRKGFVVDTMEVAAPWAALDAVVEHVERALLSVSHARAATCHLSHSYVDGACLYFTFAATPPPDEFDVTYRALWDTGQRAALASGANLSHHHGVGLNRSAYMADALGSGLSVLAALKHALDPNNILNPGKLGL